MQESTKFLQKEAEKILAEKRGVSDKNIVTGLIKQSNRILVSIMTHKFPFDFFPDTLNVEEKRVTIITRKFFFSSEVHSVDIKDISNVFINIIPFFAQLVIVSKTFRQNEVKIRYLWKSEAIYARKIIEGLRLFESKQIDTSVYTEQELIDKLNQLNTTDIVT
jgi:hypothetical protein